MSNLIRKLILKLRRLNDKFLISFYIFFKRNLDINIPLKNFYILKYQSFYKNQIFEDFILYKKLKKIYHIEPSFESFKQNSLLEEKTNYELLLNLKNCKIVGESNFIILDNEKVIYLTKDKDYNKRFKYTEDALLRYDEYMNLFFIKKEKNEKEIEQGIYFGGNYSYNYYHFLIEFIAKFKLLEEMKLDKNIPLLVDINTNKIPQYKELIDRFNKSNRKIILIEKNKIYNLRSLYYIDTATIIPPNLKDKYILKSSDTLFDINVLEYLRNFLIDEDAKDINYPKKIFLSRKNASYRRKFNEKEVENFLLKNEFEIIYPEDYSVKEQIKLFYNAKVIIGGGGAAFTNLLFCNPGAKVFLLTNYKIKTSLFSILAYMSKVDLLYITDQSLDKQEMNDIHREFKINIKLLEKILKENELKV